MRRKKPNTIEQTIEMCLFGILPAVIWTFILKYFLKEESFILSAVAFYVAWCGLQISRDYIRRLNYRTKTGWDWQKVLFVMFALMVGAAAVYFVAFYLIMVSVEVGVIPNFNDSNESFVCISTEDVMCDCSYCGDREQCEHPYPGNATFKTNLSEIKEMCLGRRHNG